MNELQFPGARWWKFDFHTHTPASDYKDEDITHESWLKAFMDKGIECVAITDHNSGGWIDELKRVLNELKNNPPDWYKTLYLFPGVEISVNGNVHVLAIFGRDKDKEHIDGLLGAVEYQGTKGDTDDVTKKSLTQVIDVITEHGGIPIPAHVDGTSGLFEDNGLTLQQILRNQNIYAMELRDSNCQ